MTSQKIRPERQAREARSPSLTPPRRMLLAGGLLLALVSQSPSARAGDDSGGQSRRSRQGVLLSGEAEDRVDGSSQRKRRKRAPSPAPGSLKTLLDRFAHEPSVQEVQGAAVRLVMAEASGPQRWIKRAARAAWLPKVQLGAGLQQRREEGLDQQAGTASRLRAGATNQMAYEIKMSWDLPRLIFDPNTLKVVQQAQRIAELREQVVLQVTRLYFERRQLQLEGHLRPSAAPATLLRRELRLAELTALLNALTGGLFSPESARKGRRGP